IAVGILAGIILSVVPALLKYYLGVPEAILFVMLGFILELLNQYLFLYTDLAHPNSATMPRSIRLAAEVPQAAMYIITFAVFATFAILMNRSVAGYRIKTVGLNPAFTQACGISSLKTLMVSAAFGGALAGLAGLLEVLSVYHFMYYNFAKGFAFLGISAALLGKFSPLGMLLASLLFGALNSGSIALAATTGVSDSIVQVIQGFITLLATASAIAFVRQLAGKRKSRRNNQ
ncbi:MAG: ABC transporter permease, partial [Clostridiaceae bacterium]|nr:ABC transporter permease [Clostridiaceae bacterium]